MLDAISNAALPFDLGSGLTDTVSELLIGWVGSLPKSQIQDASMKAQDPDSGPPTTI